MDHFSVMLGEVNSKVDSALSLLQEMKAHNELMSKRITVLEHWRVYVTAFGAGVSVILVALWKILTGAHG
jgi:hypothetical protein